MCKRGICDTEPAISLKQSSLEPKLLYRVSIEALFRALSIGDKSGDLRGNFGLLFREQTFPTADVSHTSCRSATKFLNVGVLPIATYSPNIVNFVPGVL